MTNQLIEHLAEKASKGSMDVSDLAKLNILVDAKEITFDAFALMVDLKKCK